MVPGPERRRTSRVEASVEAEVQGRGQRPFAVEVENLSVVGLMARTDQALPVGTRCRITLGIDGTRADAMAVVARIEDGRIALRFEELPYESFERLRALLLRNAEDPRIIADEISERMGFLGETG
jgi:hypothetical protein